MHYFIKVVKYMIDENNDLIKQGLVKVDRSLNLIANFIGDYAQGWYLAVGKYFKDTLDIKYTERVETVKIDGVVQYDKIIDNNGNTKNKQKRRKVSRLTQGPFYCFDAGHVIYDTPKAYLQWSEALKHLKIRCEVLMGTPNRFKKECAEWSKVYEDKDGCWWAKKRSKGGEPIRLGKTLDNYLTGQVKFKLSKPNKDKSAMEAVGQYSLTQTGFVEFLKTGNLGDAHVEELI
jgi:hypothetical protein